MLHYQLEAAGRSFRTRTDTEVLLVALIHWGTDALEKIDGMYAIAFYDGMEKRLLLARDPFGEKPLYYIRDARFFAFASELHALQILPDFNPDITQDAIADYLYFQYNQAPSTLYRQISKLPPGHWLQIRTDLGGWRQGRHFRSGSKLRRDVPPADAEGPIETAVDELEELLVESLRRRLQSDVPVGLFLSGGVDSTLVLALLTRRLGRSVNTYTIGFAGHESSEHEQARAVAAHFGSQHREKILAPDELGDVAMLGRILDEPNADTSCLPTWLLCQMAREEITVALSGDGADELFGGYERYTQTLNDVRSGAHPHPEDNYLERLAVFRWPDLMQIFPEMPPGFQSRLNESAESLRGDSRHWLRRLCKHDAVDYLPGAVLAKMDRMSMQHGLEVRTPFLNRDVARFAGGLAAGHLHDGTRGKQILRAIAARHLPAQFLDRKKTGFGANFGQAHARRLCHEAIRLVEDPNCQLSSHLDRSRLLQFLQAEAACGRFRVPQAWSLIVLENYLRSRPSRAAAGLPAFSLSKTAHLAGLAIGNAPATILHQGVPPVWAADLFRGADVISCTPESVDDPTLGHDSNRRWLLLFPLENLQREILSSLRKLNVPSFFLLLPGQVMQIFLSRQSASFAGEDESGVSRRLNQLQARLARLLSHRLPIDSQHASTAAMNATPQGEGGFSTQSSYEPTSHAAPETTRFKPYGLHAYRCRIIPESAVIPAKLEYQLFENDRPLALPGCALEDVVRVGLGRHRRKGRFIYFSTSDNSDPNRNGRSYRFNPMQGHRWNLVQGLFDIRGREPFFVRRNLRLLGASGAKQVGAALPRPEEDLAFLKPLIKKWPVGGDPSRMPAAADARVVLFTSHLRSGGAERQLCILARLLQKSGIPVTVWTKERPQPRDHYLNYLHSTGILRSSTHAPDRRFNWTAFCALPTEKREVFFSLPERLQGLVWNAFTWLVTERPAVLHCYLDRPNLTGAIAGWLAGVPRLILSLRSADPTGIDFNPEWSPLYRQCLQLFASQQEVIFTGNSRQGIHDYATWCGLPESRFVLTRNVLEMRRFPVLEREQIQATRRSLDLDPAAPIVVGAFRLSPEKGPIRFLEVAGRVLSRHPSVHFVICGEGQMETEFRRTLEAMPDHRRIHHLGARQDVAAIIGAADLFLLTSDVEGTPNVLLEAQAMGIPVVATAVGGTPEAVVDGKTGRLRERDDLDGLANDCLVLLDQPDLRRQLGEAGQAFVKENFSAENALRDTLHFYPDPHHPTPHGL